MRITNQILFLSYIFFFLIIPSHLFAVTRGISVISKEGESLYLYKDYYALVVGVSDYDHWPDLQGAEDDARETAKVLEDFGFNVSMLINPTSRELREKLNSLVYDTGREEDRAILFYFSGHGETETLATGEKLGYIIPNLAKPEPKRGMNILSK
ncbi:MAG: caspase family protein, partial [Candidatus Scalindua sp.]